MDGNVDDYEGSRGGGGRFRRPTGATAGDGGGYEGSRGGGGVRRPGGRAAGESGIAAPDESARRIESRLPGKVWRMFDKNVGQFLLWQLPDAVLSDTATASRIDDAAKLSMGLRHEHLRTCLEYVDGALRLHDWEEAQQGLSVWLRGFSSGRATPEIAFQITRQLAAALDYAASNNAVPQNFGPDSVTILPEVAEGTACLEEFVVADAVGDALRRTGALPAQNADDAKWRAPECRGGAEATAASNQWTLAALLYWILSGRLPDETAFRPLRQLGARQNMALLRALSSDPGRRFESCADFAEMVETGHVARLENKTRRRAVLAAAILVFGAAAAVWQVKQIRDAGKAIELPPEGSGSLEEIPVKTLSPEAEKQLSNALEAQKAGDWAECLKAARAVLAEDPDNEQARALVTEAEDGLRPWLRIEADKPGAWIVRKGEKVRLPTSIRLEPGAKEGPWDVTATVGGATWSAFVPEFTVEAGWSGVRTRKVTLSPGAAGAGAERKRRTVTLPDGSQFTMIWCPPGTFRFGERGSGNEREVRLTRGFWLAETELTIGQWKSVKGRSPSSLAKWNNSFKQPPIADINARPLENVSWEEASAFVGELNASGCDLDLLFRLPTEAEWEYACRAGTAGDYAGNLDDMAWFAKTAKTVSVVDTNTRVTVGERVAPQPPSGKKPNAWGFFDMHGNVAEWCADFWTERPWAGMAKSGATDDPAVLSGGGRDEGHVVRGGDVRRYASECASHARRQVAKPPTGPRDGFAGMMDAISKMQGGDDRHYEDIGLRLAADEASSLPRNRK